MKTFDSYEISPCQRLDDAGLPDPNGNTFEVCEPHEADVWTLYGHIPGEGAMAIGDFATREDAEGVFQRITGIAFASTSEVQARLRVMHAGARLLAALKALASTARTFRNVPKKDQAWTSLDDDALEDAFDAIAEAHGRSA